AVAKRKGTDIRKLSGTVQNDILKEYIARGTYIYPPPQAMRIVTDIFAYGGQHLPGWNTISISGYHMREAGCTAAQEIAFTLANGLCYVESAIAAGLNVDDFASRIALRTQQIIAYESGAPQTVDPLGGSYYIESLTQQLEQKAQQYLEKIDALGGVLKAIGKGFMQQEIQNAAYEFQQAADTGEAVVVGVN